MIKRISLILNALLLFIIILHIFMVRGKQENIDDLRNKLKTQQETILELTSDIKECEIILNGTLKVEVPKLKENNDNAKKLALETKNIISSIQSKNQSISDLLNKLRSQIKEIETRMDQILNED